ncbi:NAF1-domain-containing protein [Hypoxylon fragiforme]|uniref:NAF1-domain-containing protein n=1 Tax=Hypoxylon fragiforme TaxID=63214 RepID=UPI0020C732C0|nr:NAF1-domain-containing protein [Hypoxylon fragiforme]KAI2606925.1 NAF1-domain-containing protein [Hypoxylon fragiforme]
MSGQIPGLTMSGPDTSQSQSGGHDEANQITSQPSMEMEIEETAQIGETAPSDNPIPSNNAMAEEKVPENTDIEVGDAPSPPSLTSALEALLGSLDPPAQEPAQEPGLTNAQPNNTEENDQPPEHDDQGNPEWEEDSSPYESSSDSSSSEDSDEESEDGKNYKLLGPEETARMLMEMEGGSDDEGEGKGKGTGSGAQVRTKNEQPEEVVPKPDITITPEMEILELGVVEHVVESTVVIKATTTGEFQVLDTGSVVCTEDRTVIAAVADLIGNVRQPRYTARFTNEEEIKSYGLELGAKVFYPPSHASYVFTQSLRQQKGTDASNWHDEEAGDDEVEFSDDEKEAEHKRQLKAKKRGGRGGKGTAVGGREGRGHSEAPSFPGPDGLKYDDDEDGPYRKLARPSNFAQAPPASSAESGYTNGHASNNSTFRGGRSRGPRGNSYGRGGRGNRGDSRGGHSLPPRPPRGQEYQPQPQQQYGFPPAPPPPSMLQFYGALNGTQQPNTPLPFAWPQNAPQGFVPPPPPPPPQFTGQQANSGPYYNPEFLAALQRQMQSQPGQQNNQWSGHGGAS